MKGRTISHIDEIGEVKGWRLGAIIHKLRLEYSWSISTEYRGPQNIAYYSLAKDANRKRLRFPRSALSLNAGAKDG